MRLAAALVLLAIAEPVLERRASAADDRAWFPITGDATAGGSFGAHGIGLGNLFLGFQHGFRFEGDGSGLVFAAGPVYTARWFDPRSLGCPGAEAVAAGAASKPNCATGHSWGLQLRAGIAFDVSDDHHHEVPDHLLYASVTPLTGVEPRLSLSDGYVYDHDLRGVRLAVGWNYLAWTRLVGHLPLEGKDDGANILMFPFALLNKLELHYERTTLTGADGDGRFGILSGFGF